MKRKTSQATTVGEDVIYWRDIFQACEHHDLDGVKYYLDNLRVPITSKNYNGETPAHVAARRCHSPLLKYLLEREPKLQKEKDIFGNTVLHLVTMCGSLDLVKYLIMEREMDMYQTASPHLGNGPVHMAAHEGWVHILRYFFDEKNVDVNLRNRMGQPLALIAALNKKLRVVKFLVEERNADIFLTDDNNDNILLISARIGDLSIPIYLLDVRMLKFDLNWKDRFGGTVVHQAARHNHVVILEYFVGEKKADFNAQDIGGRTPLHEAAEQNNIEAVQYLVEQGADPLIPDEQGKTPLQMAKLVGRGYNGNVEVIQYLEQYKPPERKRRSLQESFYIPYPIRDGPIQTLYKIAGKSSTIQTSLNLPYVNSFLTLVAWLRNTNQFSFRFASTPSESIRNRMDTSAIDAVNAFSVFEEC